MILRGARVRLAVVVVGVVDDVGVGVGREEFSASFVIGERILFVFFVFEHAHVFFTLDFLTVRTNVFSSVQYRSQDVRAAQYANELLRHWIDHGQPPDLPPRAIGAGGVVDGISVFARATRDE